MRILSTCLFFCSVSGDLSSSIMKCTFFFFPSFPNLNYYRDVVFLLVLVFFFFFFSVVIVITVMTRVAFLYVWVFQLNIVSDDHDIKYLISQSFVNIDSPIVFIVWSNLLYHFFDSQSSTLFHVLILIRVLLSLISCICTVSRSFEFQISVENRVIIFSDRVVSSRTIVSSCICQCDNWLPRIFDAMIYMLLLFFRYYLLYDRLDCRNAVRIFIQNMLMVSDERFDSGLFKFKRYCEWDSIKRLKIFYQILTFYFTLCLVWLSYESVHEILKRACTMRTSMIIQANYTNDTIINVLRI